MKKIPYSRLIVVVRKTLVAVSFAGLATLVGASLLNSRELPPKSPPNSLQEPHYNWPPGVSPSGWSEDDDDDTEVA